MPSPIANYFVKLLVQSPLHPLLGPSVGVITVRGTKTGKSYATPVNLVRLEEGYTVVSLRSRTWWRNLRGGQDAQLRLAGEVIPVRGSVVEESTKVEKHLASYFRQYPSYAKFFHVRISTKGEPDKDDLLKASQDRVVVRLIPSPRVEPGG